MRQLLPGLAAAFLLLPAVPARAQQGSVQVTAASQVVTGDPQRLAGQQGVEPDLGVVWLQPAKRFGLFELEVRASRRGDEPHLGRVHVAFRDVKARGFNWTLEGGDTYFAPAIGDYRLANLFTPRVMFTGASVFGRSSKSTLQVVAGRASAWRNIFGSDPEALDQTIGLVRGTHRFGDWLDVNARASRVRTTDLDEFTYNIAASDQAGGGIKLAATPELQLVADASVVSYRRLGSDTWERDHSALMGASWLHRRGWLQVTASRFSPGEFPVLNYAQRDREGLFAAGDFDLFPRVRLSAGWEAFRTNLDPAGSLEGTRPPPRTAGTRQFAGVRVQFLSRSALTVRVEQGDRQSKPVRFGALQDSDTGSWTAELQTTSGRVNSFARYSRRDNVDYANSPASYTQDDASALAFVNLSRTAQVFGTATLTRNAGEQSSTTYWQAGGGAQLQLGKRDLWLRGEGTVARNIDFMAQSFIPRESMSLGLNGQLSRNLALGVNVNVDHSPMPFSTGSPWLTRSMVRLVRTMPTGTVYAPNGSVIHGESAGRGTGSIVGSVFADWNANGLPDPDESPLENIPVRIIAGAATSTGRDGQFAFPSVPVGLREVGLDPGAIPIDFDPPLATSVQIDIARGDTRRVAFGLIPLGTIEGPVVRDANGNGVADPGEEPLDGAIVILDGGARSEQVRKGRYRFDAVRSGMHSVRLLLESLPESSVIKGEAEVPATLARGQMVTTVPFTVSIEKRPEIRKVFPPKGGTSARSGASAPRSAPAARGASGAARARVDSKPEKAAASTARRDGLVRPSAYAIQVAALADLDNAREIVVRLTGSGLPAYLIEPGAGESVYRVRVGPYGTRDAARETATTLEALLGLKLWVAREIQ